MIDARPDWVISRQRAWGVPITVFVHKETGEVIPSATFEKSERADGAHRARRSPSRGADAWFEHGAAERFLKGLVDEPADWEQVTDILDVWFDSGSTHAFTLEDPEQFPGLAGIRRLRDGGKDRVMYLEGSDQHRGWFQSSLLESCGTRARAPFDVVLTHGFILDEKGEEKMSKSQGQRHVAAGHHEDLRRRHPAPVGGVVRLHRATSASGPASSRARSRPTASSGTRCAGCSARWPTTTPRRRWP